MMHKWWARRLGVVFRMLLLSQSDQDADLWEQFYSPHAVPQDFTVLDPFLGGGTSLVEAAKLGAHCVGFDVDPVACFITQMELAPPPAQLIRRRFEEIQAAVMDRIQRFYRSFVDRQPVDIIYNFWVDRLTCPECGTKCDGHPTYQIAYQRSANTQTVVCPACDNIAEISLNNTFLYCASCAERTDLRQPPVQLGKFKCPTCSDSQPIYSLYRRGLAAPRLFAKDYLTADGYRAFAPVSTRDLQLYTEAENLLGEHGSTLPIPRARIPSKGRSDARPLLYGYTRYRDLFNARQLYCLGLIGDQIRKTEDRAVRRALALAFSHCLASNNMFCGYAFGYRRLTPLFSVHSYRKISRPVEGNVWGLELGRGSFNNTVRAVISGSEYMGSPFEFRYRKSGKPVRVSTVLITKPSDEPAASPAASVKISNQSSEALEGVSSRSIDMILTDPPYFDNISYSELSDFYHVWLRKLLGKDYPGHDVPHTPLADSLFGGKRRHDSSKQQTTDRYTATLSRVFQECYRVAKDSATLAFTYHHRTAAAWACLGTCLLRSGFRVREVFPVRSEGRSGLHSYEGTIKWDSVFLCQKETPTPAVRTQYSNQVVNAVVRWAATAARKWRTHLRKSRLEYSFADESSLAMSFVVQAFSRRNLDPQDLDRALLRVLSNCEASAPATPATSSE